MVERLFELEVAGDTVPGVVWTPEGATGPRPLVLMGHGGSQHKKVDTIVARARTYTTRLGYAVAAIDAPSHGERTTPQAAADNVAAIRQRMQERKPLSPALLQAMTERGRTAVPEWIATLDAVQQLDEIGAGGPVGYWGVSMGTLIGVPFVAAEPRITAAVFGLAGLLAGSDTYAAAAASITIPIEFVFQWDDELATRDGGLALFDAFGSTEKTMHINPGGHLGIPPFEAQSWIAFFTRHLVDRVPAA